MRFKSLLVVLIFYCLFLYPKNTFANEDFNITYQIDYKFLSDYSAQVTQRTQLSNKKTNLYPSQYSIVVTGPILGDITGSDRQGPLKISSEESQGKTTIIVNFNDKPAGLDKNLEFEIKYNISGLVKNNELFKEISIPGVDGNLVENYNLKLEIPVFYGPIAYIKPKNNPVEIGDNYIINFNSNNTKSGVIVGIGDKNIYDFSMIFHLDNDSLIGRSTDIAIPSDSQFQQIIYRSIEPKPVNITTDKDNNWIASYFLAPKQSIDIKAEGTGIVFAAPRNSITDIEPAKEYLTESKYWEINDPKIINIAKSHKTPSEIYDYLINNFTYDYQRVVSGNKRLGAKNSVENPKSAICMEFTDAFIAISRAAGIPAREVNGFAFTQDEFIKPLSLIADILHSWPQYWDFNRKIWVSVDPTWGSTTKMDYFNSLDLYHLEFVKRGISSTYPPSVGSYKKEVARKDIEVKIVSDFKMPVLLPLEYSVEIPKKILFNNQAPIDLIITNPNGAAFNQIPIELVSENLVFNMETYNINIPPYGKMTVSGKIKSTNNKLWGTVPIQIKVGDLQKTINIDIEPPQLLYLSILILIFIILIIISIAILRKKVKHGKK